MDTEFTLQDRRRLAEMVGVDEASLYQALTARGYGFKPQKCVEIEKRTKGELRRWHLRPEDWDITWPELVGKKGAPPAPNKALLEQWGR